MCLDSSLVHYVAFPFEPQFGTVALSVVVNCSLEGITTFPSTLTAASVAFLFPSCERPDSNWNPLISASKELPAYQPTLIRLVYQKSTACSCFVRNINLVSEKARKFSFLALECAKRRCFHFNYFT